MIFSASRGNAKFLVGVVSEMNKQRTNLHVFAKHLVGKTPHIQAYTLA